MITKIFFFIVSIGMLVVMFALDWFWRWLAIPFVIILAVDIFNNAYRKPKKDSE